MACAHFDRAIAPTADGLAGDRPVPVGARWLRVVPDGLDVDQYRGRGVQRGQLQADVRQFVAAVVYEFAYRVGVRTAGRVDSS